ncbi:hypothetical protein ACLM5H_10255 [Fredinandcohnia humi]
MQTKEIRLRKIQNLAHDIMVEMNYRKVQQECESLWSVIDNLSRAIGELSDPSGHYSLNYIEDKLVVAHREIFGNQVKQNVSQ